MRLIIVHDESTIRQGICCGSIRYFFTSSIDALRVQQVVYVIDGGLLVETRTGITFQPGGFKAPGIGPPAFKTGAMAGREGCSFVQEEELCVPVGGHHGAFAAFEFQYAGDPCFEFKGALYLLMLIVQEAAVAHPRAPGGRADQVAIWVYAVSEHGDGYLSCKISQDVCTNKNTFKSRALGCFSSGLKSITIGAYFMLLHKSCQNSPLRLSFLHIMQP